MDMEGSRPARSADRTDDIVLLHALPHPDVDAAHVGIQGAVAVAVVDDDVVAIAVIRPAGVNHAPAVAGFDGHPQLAKDIERMMVGLVPLRDGPADRPDEMAGHKRSAVRRGSSWRGWRSSGRSLRRCGSLRWCRGRRSSGNSLRWCRGRRRGRRSSGNSLRWCRGRRSDGRSSGNSLRWCRGRRSDGRSSGNSLRWCRDRRSDGRSSGNSLRWCRRRLGRHDFRRGRGLQAAGHNQLLAGLEQRVAVQVIPGEGTDGIQVDLVTACDAEQGVACLDDVYDAVHRRDRQ